MQNISPHHYFRRVLGTGKHEIFAVVKFGLFFYFDLFARGHFCGFLIHGKVGLVEGNEGLRVGKFEFLGSAPKLAKISCFRVFRVSPTKQSSQHYICMVLGILYWSLVNSV